MVFGRYDQFSVTRFITDEFLVDDPENPQNWGTVKKYLVGMMIVYVTYSLPTIAEQE
jgi:hypothetical protein